MRKLAPALLCLILLYGCATNEVGSDEPSVTFVINNHSTYPCTVYLANSAYSHFARIHARTGTTEHEVPERYLDRDQFFIVIDPIGKGAGIVPNHPERETLVLGPYLWTGDSRLVLDIQSYMPTSSGSIFPDRT